MIIRHTDNWHPWSRCLPKRKMNYRRNWEAHRNRDGTHIKRTARRTWQQWQAWTASQFATPRRSHTQQRQAKRQALRTVWRMQGGR